MLHSLRPLGLDLVLFCLAPAVAQAGPGLPRPAAEMSQLAFFAGTFACTGDAFQTPMSQPHPVERTIAGKMDLDGFWLFMRFDDKRTEANRAPIHGNWQLGYDATDKAFVALWTDNLGRWFPQRSAGWQGDTIAFAGEFSLNDRKGSVRDTFTRKSETEMIMTVDVQFGGDWMRLLQFKCEKQ